MSFSVRSHRYVQADALGSDGHGRIEPGRAVGNDLLQVAEQLKRQRAHEHHPHHQGPLLRGKKVRVLGDPDAPHTFSYVPNVARALAVLGTDERSWGRLWHVPSAEPVTQRQALTRMAELAQAPAAKVGRLPDPALRVLGLAVPMLRELQETAYQRTRPYVLDSTAATATFGITATPLDEGLAATVAWWRGRSGSQPSSAPGARVA